MTLRQAIVMACVCPVSAIALALVSGAASFDDKPRPPQASVAAPRENARKSLPLVTKARLDLDQTLVQPPTIVSPLASSGIRLKPDHQASPAERTLRERISGLLHEMEFEPPERKRHFLWMDQYKVSLIKWSGTIQSLEETPLGFKVRVRVKPIIVVPDMRTASGDYFLEDYLYTGDDLVYVGYQDPGSHLQGFVEF